MTLCICLWCQGNIRNHFQLIIKTEAVLHYCPHKKHSEKVGYVMGCIHCKCCLYFFFLSITIPSYFCAHYKSTLFGNQTKSHHTGLVSRVFFCLSTGLDKPLVLMRAKHNKLEQSSSPVSINLSLNAVCGSCSCRAPLHNNLQSARCTCPRVQHLRQPWPQRFNPNSKGKGGNFTLSWNIWNASSCQWSPCTYSPKCYMWAWS